MDNERQLSKFIERLYEAALDHSVWDRLLPDLFDHFKSNFGGLYAPVLATGGSDGFLDQVCKFVTVDLSAEEGETEATVHCSAPEAIEGTDSINLVPAD